MILGPFSARPPSVELIDQEPATRRQATVMKFNLIRRNARFQGETPTSICIACETSPRVLSRRPAGTTRCESSSKARWLACGRGSVGRASPCQGEGRGFESRRPLGEVFRTYPRGGVAERRGNGLQIRVHGFKSRLHLGRLAQWSRASLTRKRSPVQTWHRPQSRVGRRQVGQPFCHPHPLEYHSNRPPAEPQFRPHPFKPAQDASFQPRHRNWRVAK